MSEIILNVKGTKDGVSFNVRVFGPTVEFYDARYDFTEYGQFVSSYFKSTLLEDLRHPSWGLCLDGGVEDWSIPAKEYSKVLAWLEGKWVTVNEDDIKELKELTALNLSSDSYAYISENLLKDEELTEIFKEIEREQIEAGYLTERLKTWRDTRYFEMMTVLKSRTTEEDYLKVYQSL